MRRESVLGFSFKFEAFDLSSSVYRGERVKAGFVWPPLDREIEREIERER